MKVENRKILCEFISTKTKNYKKEKKKLSKSEKS